MRVFCTGRFSEPHEAQWVAGDRRAEVTVYECPACKYDVHVEHEYDTLEPDDVIELHRLATQLTEARRRA